MHDLSAFDTLPDEARVWTYLADRALSDEEQQSVLAHLEPFLRDWTSHRRVVSGLAAVTGNRVLVLAATLNDGDISGCGIDKSVHRIEAAASALGFSWLDALQVAYRDGEQIQAVSRPTFRRLVRDGLITPETRVLDLTATTLGALRRQGLERPASSTWHGRVFRIPASAES